MTIPPVRLLPWAASDLDLLRRLTGDPRMMEHLGGPESPAQVAARQARYERPDSGMFKILDVAGGEAVGSVGFWEREWRGDQIYETGWSVLAAFQGRGLAVAATSQVIALARTAGKRRFVHAFPAVDNPPSNGICRRLGFTLIEACEIEFPPGNRFRCNDWRLDLGLSDGSRGGAGPALTAGLVRGGLGGLRTTIRR